MESIYFCLKYCYGIKSFDYKFSFDKDRRAHIIYAPNGVMKTSFANTLLDYSSEDSVESRDRYDPDAPYLREVKYGDSDGIDLDKGGVFVIESRNEYYYTEKMSLLLADQELKARYDSLHRDIDTKVEDIVRNLIKSSGKREARSLFCLDFGINQKDFVDELCRIHKQYSGKSIEEYSTLKYSDIVSEDTEKIFKNPDVVEKIDNYIKQLSLLLTKSIVFRPEFSHTSAEDILDRLDKNGFFQVGHSLLLAGQKEGLGSKEYRKLIVDEKERIINKELSAEFKQIDEILSKKNANIALRKFILEHQELIPKLINFEDFKRDIWISYLFSDAKQLTIATSCFEESKEEIQKIISDANKQKTEWQDVVEEFNHRFIDMPYLLDVENKEDVILVEVAPSLVFKVKNGQEYKPVAKELLLKCLSEGEKKTLYLLNVLFNIEVLKKRREKAVLIIDDIADSFDYKNKYAIIEYLIDIIKCEKFYPIILTHNFDFYRTLASRANLKQSIWFAEKNNGDIHLSPGEYTRDVFNSWKRSAHSDARIFVASISFLRNLAEYQYGEESENYKKYTSLLHYKKHEAKYIIPTEEIFIETLIAWVNTDWLLQKEVSFSYVKGSSAFQFIIDLADSIAKSLETPIHIEYKICLSIAIRLLAERYMVSKIDNDSETDAITKNQTRELRNLVESKLNMPADSEILKLIDRVLIMTSENIHINSFMYEPIIDLSLNELKQLYQDVSETLCVK